MQKMAVVCGRVLLAYRMQMLMLLLRVLVVLLLMLMVLQALVASELHPQRLFLYLSQWVHIPHLVV